MAIRFNVDEAKTLSFPYGDFQETESSYPNEDGSRNGTRDTLYATASLHKKLQSAGMGAEATMVVVKVMDNNRQVFQVTSVGDAVATQQIPEGSTTPFKPVQMPSATGSGEAINMATLQCTMEDHFNFCAALFAAWSKNTGIQHAADNVQSLAQTLFKTSDVKRIWTVAEGEEEAPPSEDQVGIGATNPNQVLENEDDDLPF
jgi:hypothetical protein